MNARLRHYQLLWHAALAQAHERTHAILMWLAGIFTVVCTTIIALGFDVVTGIGWGACMLAGFALFAWGMLFVPGALGLNTPVNAQLVPVMRARLVEMAALLWIGAMGLLAAGLFVVNRNPAEGLALAIAMTLGVAGGINGVRGAWVVIVLLVGGVIGGKYLPASVHELVRGPGAGIVLVLALLPLGVLAARALFPQAGKRHWVMMAHRESMVGGTDKEMKSAHIDDAWNRVTLRRVLARRKPDALMMRALSPDLTVSSISGLVGAMLGWAGMSYLGKSGGWTSMAEVLTHIGWFVALGILLPFLFHAGAASTWLMRSRGEQALVRLAPAMPAAPCAFNRLLAHGLLRQGLRVWALVTLAVIVLANIADAGSTTALWQACVCCMTLPALALALRDHARAPSWSVGFMWLFAFGLSSFGPLVGAIGFMLFGLPFWPCATAAAIALAVLLVQRRLRLMVRAPIAFPVGRLD